MISSIRSDSSVRWRITLVAILTASIVLAGCATSPQAPSLPRPTIDFAGNVYPNGVGPSATGADLWNQLTPENAGKWASVERVRDVMNWAPLDEAYSYAKDRGIPFRFHTLVWGQQQPGWLVDLSPEEQFAELTEWMTLVAERYPEIDFIDVVNEPVHEVPVYALALGGRGATGIDWVVKSFEMARELFPNALLHVNDYNILTDRSQIDTYLDIIAILQGRGLVDGIGLQAHSLERATISAVAGKLDRLAETGLPLYVTELDVAIRDDVRQAEQFSALFSTMASHPAVQGITLWGSVEGRLWRQNAELIRRDGSYRPAMEWLLAYMDGREYEIADAVPAPRTGTATNLRIEAEEFDDQQGVEVGGNAISYVDGGDYVGFSQVAIRVEYSSVRIRYAKGSDGRSLAKVMLLRPDGFELGEFTLESTGGWGTFAEIEFEYAPTEGTYDVYLVFEGGEGVGNIDYVEFFQPGANATLPLVDAAAADEPPLVAIETELATLFEGIEIAEGGFIAYLDDMDYALYEDVDFGAGVSRLLVSYAKASTTKAGVELRLGSLESSPVFTFQLVTTGGWNDFKLAQAAIPQITGVHDVYITFRQDDTTGIGNFDWFRFFAE